MPPCQTILVLHRTESLHLLQSIAPPLTVRAVSNAGWHMIILNKERQATCFFSQTLILWKHIPVLASE